MGYNKTNVWATTDILVANDENVKSKQCASWFSSMLLKNY